MLLREDVPVGVRAEEAESTFRQVIKAARGRQGRWLELKTTVLLCRLLRDLGRAEEAREMLGEIYGWFTEGFDTTALREARALLDELSA